MAEQIRLDRTELATVVQRMLAGNGVLRVIIEAGDGSGAWRVGAFDLDAGFSEDVARAQILSLQNSLQAMYALAGNAADGLSAVAARPDLLTA
jgi:hypothetical protein